MIYKVLVTVFLIFHTSTCRYLEDSQSIVLSDHSDHNGQQEITTLAQNQEETENVNRNGQLHPRARIRQKLLNEKEPPEVWGIISYHKTKFKRAYINTTNHVAVYFEEQVQIDGDVPWVFNLTSQVWSYMTETYGSIGRDSYLSLAIHEVIHPKNRTPFYREYSIEAGTGVSGVEKRNFLEFGVSRLNPWLNDTPHGEDVDMLINQLSHFVEKSSKQRYGSPSENIWKDPSYDATAFLDIFTYDVYVNLGLLEDAARYKEDKMKKFHQHPKSPTFWFRNWFLPLYTNCGGNKVLNEYFQLLSNLVPYNRVYYTYELNMGDFVYFWSAAVEKDLRDAANATFGWNETYESQFEKAEEKFPTICYDCSICENKTVIEEQTDADTPTKQNAKGEDNSDSYLLISLAISIPIILILILFLLLFICSIIFYKRKINFLQTSIRALTADEVNEFFDGSSNVNTEEAHSLVLSLPFVKQYEIPRSQLRIDGDKLIGSGQFGCVLHGFVEDSDSKELTPVAVKTVKPNVDVLYFKAMLSEAKIMASLGQHSNIVALIATCTANIKNREIFIALEFCPLGDLHSYLKKERQNYTHLFPSFGTPQLSNSCTATTLSECNTAGIESGLASNNLSTLDLLKWSQEVSNGMVYLTEKKVIHGDLAARNVLLTSNRVAQISDFGLSRQLLNYANYKKETQTPLPWRWMAIESLKDMKFSVASDVWAFGVTLWEVFSLAETPYSGWTWNYAFVDRLYGGERLGSPQYGNKRIFELMLTCWTLEDTKRPTFKTIYDFLDECITTLSNRQRITQDNYNDDGQQSHYLTLTEMEAESQL